MTQAKPFDDAATRDAARRLVRFLESELELLPPEHPWRRGYTRELIHVSAAYEISEEE